MLTNKCPVARPYQAIIIPVAPTGIVKPGEQQVGIQVLSAEHHELRESQGWPESAIRYQYCIYCGVGESADVWQKVLGGD